MPALLDKQDSRGDELSGSPESSGTVTLRDDNAESHVEEDAPDRAASQRSLSRRLAVLLAGLLFFGAASFYTAASVLEAPSNRSAVPPPRKRTSRRYLGTNSSKKKRLRGAA